ncbi:MAG: calcium:proton antiporter, partial [Pseudobdellovibrio sp.]
MKLKLTQQLGMNDLLSVLAFGALLISLIFPSSNVFYTAMIALFLGVGISTAVHSAEVIAQRVGPALGTLILALAVTIIEVALIVSLMNNKAEGASMIARDTVFAAIMIVTNGIIGVCIFVGGLRHKELTFQKMGTSALLAVLVVLSVLTLVLPNFTTSAQGPYYTPGQLIFASVASILLYGSLVFAQTKSHKNYFEAITEAEREILEENLEMPTKTRSMLSFVTLILSLVAVVGLAKILSPSIEAAITAIGAPKAVVGIVVALLVLAPETLAAVNAARINQLQTSLNLALGSGAASIALTIPVVSIYSLVTEQNLTLGLDPKNLIFLILTFLAGSMTVGVGRSTALHGIV